MTPPRAYLRCQKCERVAGPCPPPLGYFHYGRDYFTYEIAFFGGQLLHVYARKDSMMTRHAGTARGYADSQVPHGYTRQVSAGLEVPQHYTSVRRARFAL